MKRDMDLVRKILFELERKDHLIAASDGMTIEGESYSPGAVLYHVQILADSPYVMGVLSTRGHISHYRLTWAGHEFLETIRDDTRWNELKEASAKAGAASIEAIAKAALGTAIKLVFSYMGLPS